MKKEFKDEPETIEGFKEVLVSQYEENKLYEYLKLADCFYQANMGTISKKGSKAFLSWRTGILSKIRKIQGRFNDSIEKTNTVWDKFKKIDEVSKPEETKKMFSRIKKYTNFKNYFRED